MDAVITIAMPLFFTILCGFALVYCKIVSENSVQGLVAVVFWLCLPFFIFIKTVQAPVGETPIVTLLLAYYIPCGVTSLTAVLLGKKLFGGGYKISCIRALMTISGVTGFLALPLLILVIGEQAIIPAVIITIADNLVILVGGSLLLDMHVVTENSHQTSRAKVLLTLLRKIATNPVLVSIVITIIFLQTQWTIPKPIEFFAVQMSNMTGPLALVALGTALAIHRTVSWKSRELFFFIFLKIIVLPFLVYITSKYLFNLDPILIKVAVTMAAMPIAVNVYIMASRFKTYKVESSVSMLISAVLSVLTISGLLLII